MYKSIIKRIIKEELFIRDSIDDNTNLFFEGVLDSLKTIRFFSKLEECFDVTIDLAEVEITEFETIEKINDYIMRLKKEG